MIVLLDDTEVSRAEIGPDGAFVIFLPVPPGEKAQVLSLRAELDGQARVSEDSFILAPVPQPAVEVTAIAESAQGGQDTTQPALAPTETPQAAIQQGHRRNRPVAGTSTRRGCGAGRRDCAL